MATTGPPDGYAEIRPLSHAGRMFNSVLILFGASAMLLAAGIMTQTVVQPEFDKPLRGAVRSHE